MSLVEGRSGLKLMVLFERRRRRKRREEVSQLSWPPVKNFLQLDIWF